MIVRMGLLQKRADLGTAEFAATGATCTGRCREAPGLAPVPPKPGRRPAAAGIAYARGTHDFDGYLRALVRRFAVDAASVLREVRRRPCAGRGQPDRRPQGRHRDLAPRHPEPDDVPLIKRMSTLSGGPTSAPRRSSASGSMSTRSS